MEYSHFSASGNRHFTFIYDS